MSNASIRLLPEVLRTLGEASISGTYAPIGSPLDYPARIIHFTNTTDVLLTYSFDGVHDHFVIPEGSFLLLDITTNQSGQAGVFNIAAGTKFYVKGDPSTGATYIAVFYGAPGQ